MKRQFPFFAPALQLENAIGLARRMALGERQAAGLGKNSFNNTGR
jgi:hypothetical protein